MTRIATLTLLLLASSLSPSHGAIIVSEDFEPYVDTTEMIAVWSGGPGTLDTSFAFGGVQSANHLGGTVNNYAPGIGSVVPTANEDVILSAVIYDPDGPVNDDRITVGLRTGAAPLFEMGRYNSFTVPTTGLDTYGIRALSMGNGITPLPTGSRLTTEPVVQFPQLSAGIPMKQLLAKRTD